MDDEEKNIPVGRGGLLTPRKRGNKFGRRPGVLNHNTKMLKEAIL
jgi:hypothetical protein